MRPGIRLGVDVGRVRIGVARSDPEGMLAVPLETVPRVADDTRVTGRPGADVERIISLVTEYAAVDCVVGRPVALSGAETASTRDAVAFGERLRVAGVPVRYIDERLSTVTAVRDLQAAGRSARRQRAVVDQAAAVVILQQALDAERSQSGQGHTVEGCAG